ncbi:MAG: M14 family zinc carboxypeptidase, partial [Fidelibacterota bacterium]
GADPEMTFLVNHREIWFIPIINVDGFVYNQTQHPEGGGMHRKNRRETGCGEGNDRGVDINRNFDYDWGGPGASSYPCDNTFRGDSAFSEPESRVVRDFILNHDFSNVLHYHAYGNVLIFPFGDGSYPPEPDETTYREIGAAMTVVNGFPVGTGNELLNYSVSGDQTDWTYGVAGSISYIPEVGTNQDNFWPSENRVLPLCEEQVVANEVFARVAGPDLRIKPPDALHQATVTDSILFLEVENRGLRPGTNISLAYHTLNALVETDAGSVTIPSLAARSTDTLAIPMQMSPNAVSGLETGFIVTLSGTNAYTITDTIRWIIGTPSIVFMEDFESGLGNWNLSGGSWGLTDDSYSGQFALSDSPVGPYPPHAMNVIQLAVPVDLRGLAHPTLQLAAHWDIEPNWDFVQIQAYAPGMSTVSLAGTYTSTGTGQGSQPLGEPGYHGRQNDWVLDALDLSPVANQSQVYLRFILTSDAYVQRDGFFVDDLRIQGYPAYQPGDANLDMNWDIADVLTISDWLEISPFLTALQRMLADVNQDSVLNDLDVSVLLEQIMEATP